MRYFFLWSVFLLLLGRSTGRAQQISMTDLLTYLHSSDDQFEEAMLRKRFICYRASRDLTDRTCLFAYAANTLMARPEVATGLLQYVRNLRSDILLYQLHSREQFWSLQRQLIRLGYSPDSLTDKQAQYSRGNTVVNCRRAETYSCISGNPAGYSIALVRRHY